MAAVRPDHTAGARRFPTLSLAAALAAALAGCTFGQEQARSAPAPVTAARGRGPGQYQPLACQKALARWAVP